MSSINTRKTKKLNSIKIAFHTLWTSIILLVITFSENRKVFLSLEKVKKKVAKIFPRKTWKIASRSDFSLTLTCHVPNGWALHASEIIKSFFKKPVLSWITSSCRNYGAQSSLGGMGSVTTKRKIANCVWKKFAVFAYANNQRRERNYNGRESSRRGKYF